MNKAGEMLACASTFSKGASEEQESIMVSFFSWKNMSPHICPSAIQFTKNVNSLHYLKSKTMDLNIWVSALHYYKDPQ